MLSKPVIIALFLAAVAEARSVIRRETCVGKGQSCDIANLSGSTGIPIDYSHTVTGGSDEGLVCIASYNPDFDPSKLPATSSSGGLFSSLLGRDAEPAPSLEGSMNTKIEKRAITETDLTDGKCKANLLLFARGTTESGNMGITVGPSLQRGLGSSKWAYQGVDYEATIEGDNCLGLPGGAVLTSQLELALTRCPNSKIVVAGYSEGAMVAHNGVASASAAAKAKVVGVVVFGDPFNGAPIKGYPTSKIKTYCIASDDVCGGEFSIGIGHLSYTFGSTSDAVKYIKTIV